MQTKPPSCCGKNLFGDWQLHWETSVPVEPFPHNLQIEVSELEYYEHPFISIAHYSLFYSSYTDYLNFGQHIVTYFPNFSYYIFVEKPEHVLQTVGSFSEY